MSDWLKKANRMLGDIAGQAGRQAETLQLQAKLGSLDTQLDEIYVEAGKRAEELLHARQVHDDELRVILERARTLREQMMEVRQQVQHLRQKPEKLAAEEDVEAAPPPSSTTASEEAATSPRPQPVRDASPERQTPRPEEAVGERACPSCGGEVITRVVYCPHCGEKQEQ